MFVELHILQNFAPSNLNRDDTNAPKDCEFGGYRRARISSQAIKRAMRRAFEQRNLVDEAHRAARTKRLHDELVRRFTEAGKPAEDASRVVEAAVQGLGLKFQAQKSDDEEKKTQYLLFLGKQEIDQLAQVCLDNWDALLGVAPGEAAGAGRGAKRAAAAAVPKEVQNALQGVLDGGKAADVALFGRMLADLPQRNVDAASQVAHAISTNRVSTEFDFYTAVDDFKPEDTEGADMMGTVEFNSACFYRYANVDLGQLARNLGDDAELVQKTLEAFIRAAVVAIPTGKQNSMAAQNPPSFVLAVVREDGLWSLANAFLKPVTPSATADLVTRSEQALASYWEQLATMYGTDGVRGAWFISLDGAGLEQLAASGVVRVANLSQLVANVTAAANGSPA
ncbi:MAG: type I-E CRISPR-associated protein Cas7/Cse4/CasC [Chloroflexi bacterium]|nr:MAG: type I-E CRISPR-associated protein Cas7/Cse4/CasC [Chloroflexota bacterium]